MSKCWFFYVKILVFQFLLSNFSVNRPLIARAIIFCENFAILRWKFKKNSKKLVKNCRNVDFLTSKFWFFSFSYQIFQLIGKKIIAQLITEHITIKFDDSRPLFGMRNDYWENSKLSIVFRTDFFYFWLLHRR